MEDEPGTGVRVVFWTLQLLLASLLLMPAAVILIGGATGFREFAEWIVLACVLIGGASVTAQLLRRSGRYGIGSAVLLLAFVPFLLFFYFLYSLAASFRS
jgi:hypothetical protein